MISSAVNKFGLMVCCAALYMACGDMSSPSQYAYMIVDRIHCTLYRFHYLLIVPQYCHRTIMLLEGSTRLRSPRRDSEVLLPSTTLPKFLYSSPP
jgi:hypothetical protein